jgi:hypothetical protein
VKSNNRRVPPRSRATLVIPKMTWVSTVSPILRSRVSRKTWAQLSQSGSRYSASAEVTSMVRFSMRPWPLSFSDARSISASRRAAWRGGKTGLWLGEDRRNVRQQRRLVFLDRQDVVSPSFDHLGTDIAMREHCISGDNLSSDRQYPKQFQSRFVFVRLGIHSQLSQSGVSVGSVRSNKVDCRCVAIAAPTGCFAIDRDMSSVTCSKASLNPTTNARLELRYVDPSENPRVGSFAQTTPTGESEEIEEVPTSLFAILNDRLIAGHARKHSNHSQRKKGRERVTLAFGAARIVNAFKEFQQR